MEPKFLVEFFFSISLETPTIFFLQEVAKIHPCFIRIFM